MKRIMLFLVTNIAILAVLFIVLHLLGVDTILDEQGAGGATIGRVRRGVKASRLGHPSSYLGAWDWA